MEGDGLISYGLVVRLDKSPSSKSFKQPSTKPISIRNRYSITFGFRLFRKRHCRTTRRFSKHGRTCLQLQAIRAIRMPYFLACIYYYPKRPDSVGCSLPQCLIRRPEKKGISGKENTCQGAVRRRCSQEVTIRHDSPRLGSAKGEGRRSRHCNRQPFPYLRRDYGSTRIAGEYPSSLKTRDVSEAYSVTNTTWTFSNLGIAFMVACQPPTRESSPKK